MVSTANLPFGDDQTLQTISGSCSSDASPLHFTGKERDPETGANNGNDYFGVRYYASSTGRWLSPDKPFAGQHTSNPQSWNLYEYARNNPLRKVDPNGFKVIQSELQEAVNKMTKIANAGGGRFYLDFAGIQGLHLHQSLGPPSSTFDSWHSDHNSSNSVILGNPGTLSGFLRAFFGLANKDQVDTGKAIVQNAPAGVSINFDTYSNGVNAGGKVAQGMAAGDLESSTVVGPNTQDPGSVQAMDQADLDTTQIYISNLIQPCS